MKKPLRFIIALSYIGAWSFYLFMYDDYDQKYHELSCEIIKTEGAIKRWDKKTEKLSILYNQWERFPFLKEKLAREQLQYSAKEEILYPIIICNNKGLQRGR